MAGHSLRRMGRAGLFAVLALNLSAGAARAQKPKVPSTPLDQQAFFRPELAISSAHVPLDQVLAQLPNRAAWLASAARSRFVVHVDARSGTATSILGAAPLIPGDGVGNRVTPASLGAALGREVAAVDALVVAGAARAHVLTHASLLGVDVSQLGEVRATSVTPHLWQVSIPQTVNGVPVRYGRVALTISHGNVVVMGTETWGDVALDTEPYVSAPDALEAGFAHVGKSNVEDEILQPPRLEIVPVAAPQASSGEGYSGPLGRGYSHRLVWSFVFRRPPDLARWEILVDAHSGEVLSLQDTNQYVERPFVGGVYPVTSTGICPSADRCGTLQTGWPMPFANTGFASPNNFTNSSGIYDYTSGTATTTLAGRYVRTVDSCGSTSASSPTGSINLGGSNNQHDCTTPGSGGAGNTAASRSGFYELNKLAEQARGWLPGNAWLQSQLTANMNLNQTCNAFWNGSSVNFYRSGGGCRNTGEIAAVFDHEWGHGLDDNDAGGALSNSSEAYADIAAIYRLQASCVGYGFFQTLDDGCGQTSDGTGFNTNEAQQGAAHCATDCSGVRDADWAKHSPATPDTALGFVCTSCLTGTGPCGRQVHCAAAPVRQAAWDLVTRDLTSAPFNLDSQSAFVVGNKLFYQGSGNVGAWHACTCGSSSSGCGATNGYMQWLAADDDNGNLADGTPHMTAIFNAFNRHGIACATPSPANSGCSGGPSSAPSLTATPGSFQVALAWGGVAGATRYWVFRSEGHAGCNFGKTLIAEVTGLAYTDTEVANGRAYYYNVVAAGASSACYSRVSNCVSATPTAVVTPDFGLACSPSGLTVQQGTSGSAACTVASSGGFSSPVALSCAGLPGGTGCSFSPATVTPPGDGSASSTLTVSVASTPPGSYAFQAQGTSGGTTRSANLSLTVTSVPTPDFAVAASPSSVSVTQGGSAGGTITVGSLNGFSAAVSLSASGVPSGVTASFAPNPVTPPAGGSAASSLTFTASASAATGTFPVTVTGTSGSVSHSTTISLTVSSPGGADLVAVFDAARQAPACAAVGRSCDTGPSLVLGRDTLSGGSEPNQPNTLNDSCADGTSGTFHADESSDRVKVSTLDGTSLAPGKTVRIDATGWVWSGGPTSDHVDFFYAANAASPTWTLIATVTPTSGQTGAQTFSATYTLPSGGLQAVRVQWRYSSTAAPCSAGGYNDRDDLVFAVSSPPTTTVFEDDFETAKGWTTNPNGTDTATSGQWERGDPEATSSGVALQLGATTSGVNDLVTGRLAGSSAGASDVDGGTTSVQSPAIALPSTGTLTLGFQYYLAHLTNATSADFFRASVVVGATATQVFQSLGAGSNRAGVWTPVSVSLAAFAGQTVRIRFEAADASTGSLIESAVDDVRITQQ